MVEIAICDNEIKFIGGLKKIVSDFFDNLQVDYSIDTFSSGEELIDVGMNVSKYNILFLDIEMESVNGIETARKIREYSTESYIVFVTAFAKYSLEGYSVDATRYILKNNPMFTKAINESLTSILNKMKIDTELFSFDFKECSKTISLGKIVYVESMNHILTFHIIDNGYKEYTLRDSLAKYDEMFSTKGFIRVQQSYLVNWKYITRINNYIVKLKDGTNISVSKKHYGDIKRRYLFLKGEL